MYKAVLTLETESEVKNFLEDICSMTEIMAMEQRFEVAKLLSEGLIYNAIMEKTGASSAIISRVNRSLQYGAGGYDTVFSRLKEESESGE
ncbi:MAG: TrpR-like protein [Oscillospiraceae bacterium]|jgi:TrpR-related protein YerC/YecD|nr:TrpR-like protein [Oscillospiraceae bacterium]